MKKNLKILTIIFSFSTLFSKPDKPNIIYLMCDELAYYELSHMGNTKIKTPNIDRFAREGLRFTNALAASPVCGPLRCNLLTGKHAGHSSVRVNDGGTPLRADEVTIATLLKERGYETGGYGKWGCGGRGSTGVPEKHGFDEFFGYYDQVHAHTFYPPYLIRNSKEVPLVGNNGGRSGKTYSHYRIFEEAITFIKNNQKKPFFCYLPFTPPHGMFDVPREEPAWKLYEKEAWMKDPSVPQDAKNYAVMVSMIDRQLGEIIALIKQLRLEELTAIFFTGDNGGQDRFKNQEHPRGYFGPNVCPNTGVEFRGEKRDLYEGGLRIPFLVRWPGHVSSGGISNLVFYQPDVLPTISNLCGARVPPDIDGISIAPTLIGAEMAGRSQKRHQMLYWEYSSQVAVRYNQWKAIKTAKGKKSDWALYNLDTDISETKDLAREQPAILSTMKDFALKSHKPARPGVFTETSRTKHNRDRQAKFGFSAKATQINSKSQKQKQNKKK